VIILRNNRVENTIFIGKEFLKGHDGTKHPSLINFYANLNINKTRNKFIELIGLDIETDVNTGSCKLMGLSELKPSQFQLEEYDTDYRYYTDNFLNNFEANLRHANEESKCFAFWRAFDGIHIFKLFLQYYESINDEESKLIISKAIDRYEKVSGEYRNKKWEVDPVISISTGYGEFGIKQVIRGSVQFYFIKNNGKIKTVWGYNIASLYTKSLERIADKSKKGRFDWYSKIDEESHIVDWKRFENDIDYRNKVLLSNELDSRAVLALGYEAQIDFYEAHKAYPVSLISNGGMARSAIVATIKNKLTEKYGDDEETLKEELYEAVNSIGLKSHIDKWLETYEEKQVHDLYLMAVESYSGGYIDAIRYGYAEKGFYADLASAYPAQEQKLYDLRDSEIISGTGKPKRIKYSYTFCRGEMIIPDDVDYHPTTIKDSINKETNIRPVGHFIASYTLEERDYLEEQGTKFFNETYHTIITKGKLSVLADTVKDLISIRWSLIKQALIAEESVKTQVNSVYGVTFEANKMYEDIDEDIETIGFRAGEFWNPVYASLITSWTRIVKAKACTEIAKNGGKPILIMTDSVLWKGKKTDLPRELKFSFGDSGVRTDKTLGYYEEPEEVHDIVCLGTGMYSYNKIKTVDDVKYTIKNRGYNIVKLSNDEKIELPDETLTYRNMLHLMVKTNTNKVNIKVRSLVSVGVLRSSKEFTISDLGKVLETDREFELKGTNKRLSNQKLLDPKILIKGLVYTKPLKLDFNMYGEFKYVDGTLPKLRDESMKYILKPKIQRTRETNNIRSQRFYVNNKKNIKETRRDRYKRAREDGYDRIISQKTMSWSDEKYYKFKEGNNESSVRPD